MNMREGTSAGKRQKLECGRKNENVIRKLGKNFKLKIEVIETKQYLNH
jgi:hypothetical protein